MKPKATNGCYGSNDKNHHVGEKKALSRQSSLMNNENEEKPVIVGTGKQEIQRYRQREETCLELSLQTGTEERVWAQGN